MPRFRSSDIFCLVILTMMMAGIVVGVARAQSQDFYNGTFSVGLKDLSDRMTRMEGRTDYILGGLLVSLLAQVVQIATHVRSRK